MAFNIIVFLIFVICFGFSYLRKKSKGKNKTHIQNININSEKNDASSREEFRKRFINQEFDFGWGSPKQTSNKISSTKQKQKKEECKEIKKSSPEKEKNISREKEKIEKKELTFAEKKAKGVYSTRGSVRVSGGLLPHHSSMGMIDFYYDGKKAPSLTGSRGRISIYKTDGNLQIFYKNPDDVKDKEFLGLIVDMYKI